MRLPLNPDLRENGHYESQFGSLPLVTDTHQLAIEVVQSEKVSGQFKTQYDLIISGNSVGHYKLDIEFTEV